VELELATLEFFVGEGSNRRLFFVSQQLFATIFGGMDDSCPGALSKGEAMKQKYRHRQHRAGDPTDI